MAKSVGEILQAMLDDQKVKGQSLHVATQSVTVTKL